MDELLFEAFFWNTDVVRPPLPRFREEAEFARIFDGCGRPGDRAVIAASDDLRLGAAWFRLGTPESHS